MTFTNAVRSALSPANWTVRRGQLSSSDLLRLTDRQLADIGVERRQLVGDLQGEIAHMQASLGYPYGR